MKKIFLLIVLLTNVIFNNINYAQVTGTVYAYRISFKNKIGAVSIADSASFLSAKALSRRQKQGIAVNATDLPIVKAYIDSAAKKASAFRVKNKSKWFNQIVVLTRTSNMAAVVALPYVQDVKLVGKFNGWGGRMANPNPKNKAKYETSFAEGKQERGSPTYYGASYPQIKLTNTDYLHDIGFKGEGMHVAVIDMGFSKVKKLAAFDSAKAKNQFIDQWNFVRDTVNIDSFTVGAISHGTDALSTLATNMPGVYVGSAPNANISLYISEDYVNEIPLEEDNWISAAERADSLGVDIINTSLGYFEFDSTFSTDNYTYANDFDGKTTLIARGHNMAVAKGIFCVNAMGNMGANSWKYLLTPADADSTYSVGSMDSNGSFLLSYGSSSGPSSDGQIKPDGLGCGIHVCLIANNNGLPAYTGGTSFASPLICGGITCLMQAFPNLAVWQIREMIHQSSSRYLSPSDTMGYGIPNFKIAYQLGQLLITSSLNIGVASNYYIYPNPSKHSIQIGNNKQDLKNFSYTIVDMQGKICISNYTTTGQINISNLQNGIYYLQIKNGKELVCKSFEVRQ